MVSITAPASGATVSGTAVAVLATASDNVGFAGVQFKPTVPTSAPKTPPPPYSVTWNTTTATNAPHTLTALARDAAGNVTTSTGHRTWLPELKRAGVYGRLGLLHRD